MEIFDVYIRKVADYAAQMEAAGRRVRLFQSPASPQDMTEGFPFRVGPEANRGIILRGDTSVELGNPEMGACAFTLFTDDCSRVRGGRITLIGPDISESDGKSLPFGQVLIVGGSGIENKDYEMLRYTGFVGDQIEGYMMRSLTRSVWSRVSREAASKGFSFRHLGQALMAIYTSDNSKIEVMEAIFVTSDRNDLKPLDDMGAQVQKITREIVKENRKVRGYDIECGSDCSSCDDRKVCDDIRDVVKSRC